MNLRTRSEFLESRGKISEESKQMVALADERMKESGDFASQVAFLNSFSKALNQFGIQKQLLKESKESLTKYLNAIEDIATVWGQGFVYPTMRMLVEKELAREK